MSFGDTKELVNFKLVENKTDHMPQEVFKPEQVQEKTKCDRNNPEKRTQENNRTITFKIASNSQKTNQAHVNLTKKQQKT